MNSHPSVRHVMILLIVVAFVFPLLVGCTRRAKVGNYEFVVTDSLNIEGRPSWPSIYYKGRKVWRLVLMGSDKTCRDGILIFMSTVPEDDGGVNVYPQLFALHGAGPPIILSERVLNQPLRTSAGDYDSYYLENLEAPTTNGVQAVFKIQDVLKTNDVSWSEIESYVREAEASAPIQTKPLGNFRILPMKQPQ